MSRVAVVHVFTEIKQLLNIVQTALPNTKVVDVSPLLSSNSESKVSKNQLSEVEILLADPKLISKSLHLFPALKWLHSTWAGVEVLMTEIDVKNPPNFLFTRSGDGFGPAITEYIIGYIIARERDFFGMMECQQKISWQTQEYLKFFNTSQVTIGILGVGQIGKHVAKTCKFLGMTTWGLVSSDAEDRKSQYPDIDYLCTSSNVGQLLSSCDYVCNILPSTQHTRGLLSGDVLAACKNRKTTFINVGRGDVIDDESLIKAIKSSWIDGAVLDVFNTEPLPPDSPLWTLPNVIITPHIASPSTPQSVSKAFLENLNQFSKGEKMKFEVNWTKNY
ncbi:uncharacterized protein LOC115216705 [Argonauta hians]